MSRTTLRDLAPWAVIAFGMGLAASVLKPDMASNAIVGGITAAATFLAPHLGRGSDTVVTAKSEDATITAEPAS